MGIEEHNSKTLEFIELLGANYRRVFAFILTLVPNYNDAEDIMQETCRVLWQKMDRYTPGADFAAWAVTVATCNVLDAMGIE